MLIKYTELREHKFEAGDLVCVVHTEVEVA